MVLGALPGKATMGGYLNGPNKPKLALQIATEMGKFHAIKGKDLDTVSKVLQRQNIDDMRAELDKMDELWIKFRGPWSVCGPFALKWMRRNLHLSEGEYRLAHRDVDFHNILAEGDTLTAFLDWETAQIANPANDLGYIRWSIERIMPWAEFIAAYEAAGGPTIPSEQVDFYALWGTMRVAGPMMSWCRNLVETGGTRQIEYSVVALEQLHTCMHRFASDLSRVGIA